MVKKLTSVAITALGMLFNVIVTAGTMGDACVALDVTVPCETKKWSFAVEALYLRPVLAGEAYLDPAGYVANMRSKWGWGFLLDGNYQYSTGSDIDLNWLHYDVNTHYSPQATLGFTPLGVSSLGAKVLNRFNRANVTFGQLVDVSPLQRTHFYAGAQFADINHEQFKYFAPTPTAIALDFTEINSFNKKSFNGYGALIGLDFSYGLPWGFNMIADLNASMLYGTTRTITGFVFGPTGLMTNQQNFSVKRVVAGLDAKLGLDYTQDFACGVLKVFGGYETIEYLSALASTATPGAVNFGLFGPYFGVRWTGFA